jgi:hypothetical protein
LNEQEIREEMRSSLAMVGGAFPDLKSIAMNRLIVPGAWRAILGARGPFDVRFVTLAPRIDRPVAMRHLSHYSGFRSESRLLPDGTRVERQSTMATLCGAEIAPRSAYFDDEMASDERIPECADCRMKARVDHLVVREDLLNGGKEPR